MCGTSRNFIDYPSSKLAGKLLQLPPPLEFRFNYPPSNSENFIDYPPSKSGRKTPSTTPPRIQRISSTTPPPLEIGPENSKLLQLPPPPLEFRELHRLPPSKSGRKTPSSTPLEFIHGTSSTTSFVSGVGNALERCLESVPTVKNSHFNHW